MIKNSKMLLDIFRGLTDSEPKDTTLEELVHLITDDASVRDLTDKYRYYLSTGDERQARRFKELLPCFAVAVRFSGGKHKRNICAYTGLTIVDIDHVPAEKMQQVLALVREDPHTLLAYTTVSGLGVRVIARFVLNTSNDNDNVNDNCLPDGKSTSTLTSTFSNYKQAFLQVNKYYTQLTGHATDEKCKNATRLSCLSHDPDVYYNPNSESFYVESLNRRPVGRPCRNVRPEQVEGHIRTELQQRGVEYTAGNHNNYIAQSCYLMNRYGVSEADCTEWAVNHFSDYQDSGNNVAGIVASCYLQTKEHATRRPPREERGGQATVAQIEAFLAEHVHLRRNVVTGFVEVLTFNDNVNDNDNSLPDGKVNVSVNVNVNVQEGWRQFTDDDRNSLWRALSRELGVRVVRQDISAVVKSDFSPRYHPFEEYIGSLQPWDGTTDHIDRLASMVTVCGDQNYFRRVFKKWLVAFIAAIFDPEEVNHEILVFIGRQGCYKSTWFHYLLPPELRQYFLPKLMSNSGITKDDLFKIAQSGLVCLEEIDNMKQRDLNQLKALTTMRTINERRSYGEFNELHRHIASFCATGNNRFFLTDHTGNRRFLTFEIESIVPPQTYEYNYEGVYAQAYALWRQGYRYWFNDEENDEINQCNTEFESPNKERELIMKYYRRPLPGEQCRFLTATDMLERINGGIKEQLSTVRIGMVMRELGIERIRSGNLRGYRLIENTQADIEVKQKSMGSFTEL